MSAKSLAGGCAVCLAMLLVAEPALAQRGGGGGGRGGGGGGGGGGRGMSGSGGGRSMGVPSGGPGRGVGMPSGIPGRSMGGPSSANWRGNPNWNGNWRGNNFNNWNRGWGWGWGGWGIGVFIPVYINSFGPGVWVAANDYPGYFNYYGEDGAVPSGVLYGAPGEYAGGDPSQIGPADPSYNAATQAPSNNLAFVTIRVPAPDAKVWIEDVATTDSGNVREYQSPELTKGKNYTYEIKAEWKEGNQVRKQTRKFPIHAGDHIMVVFGTKEESKDKVPPVPVQEK